MYSGGNAKNFQYLVKFFFLPFFETRVYHSQIDLKQKKNQAKMLFPSKVMKSQSP